MYADPAHSGRLSRALGPILLAVAVVVSTAPGRVAAAELPPRATPAVAGTNGGIIDELLGVSRKLRARFVRPSATNEVTLLQRLFGDTATSHPGIYTFTDSASGGPFSLITLRPFGDKVSGRIGSYRMGFWPFERRGTPTTAYEHPEGFIEVTPANQDTYVSEHFRLRDFLTHEQQNVWPTYLVLDERLVDKLELVIDELQREGIKVEHLSIMSGFRTPEYNIQGVGRGRARTSRHQYGDAADVFVDNNQDGWTDDVNHDGRVNMRDVQVIRRAVERVEQAHPELIGGVGIYRGTRRHGPFAHIDARGYRARWGGES